MSGSLRALVSAEPGSQLSVFAEAGGYVAELSVVVVRHHANGWVREIARKDEDSPVEAIGAATHPDHRRHTDALASLDRLDAELVDLGLRAVVGVPFKVLTGNVVVRTRRRLSRRRSRDARLSRVVECASSSV